MGYITLNCCMSEKIVKIYMKKICASGWLKTNAIFFLSQVQHHGANAKLKHIVVQITNSSCTVKSCLS